MATTSVPPVPGMPAEMWAWLRESVAVRPNVVARARAELRAGHHPTADEVARAMMRWPYRGAA